MRRQRPRTGAASNTFSPRPNTCSSDTDGEPNETHDHPARDVPAGSTGGQWKNRQAGEERAKYQRLGTLLPGKSRSASSPAD